MPKDRLNQSLPAEYFPLFSDGSLLLSRNSVDGIIVVYSRSDILTPCILLPRFHYKAPDNTR